MLTEKHDIILARPFSLYNLPMDAEIHADSLDHCVGHDVYACIREGGVERSGTWMDGLDVIQTTRARMQSEKGGWRTEDVTMAKATVMTISG